MISTKVGGIPEVLPDSMITLAEPNVTNLIKKLEILIEKIKSGKVINRMDMHEKIKTMYNWRDVAQRTEIVYDLVMKKESPKDLKSKLAR